MKKDHICVDSMIPKPGKGQFIPLIDYCEYSDGSKVFLPIRLF